MQGIRGRRSGGDCPETTRTPPPSRRIPFHLPKEAEIKLSVSKGFRYMNVNTGVEMQVAYRPMPKATAMVGFNLDF